MNEESFEPSVSLRKGVMEILLHLNINTETVSKTNEVQRLVARQKRSQVKELRDLGEKIILKWNKIAYEAEWFSFVIKGLELYYLRNYIVCLIL